MEYSKWKMNAPHTPSGRFANICLLPNRMQPVMVFRPSSGDDVEERLLDRFRDGAARACPDGAPVDFADRRDLNRRAGQARLVGVEQLFELPGARFYFVTH